MNKPKHPLVQAILSVVAMIAMAPALKGTPIEKTRYYYDGLGRKRIDHKAMERNKYAPWGRGVAA